MIRAGYTYSCDRDSSIYIHSTALRSILKTSRRTVRQTSYFVLLLGTSSASRSLKEVQLTLNMSIRMCMLPCLGVRYSI